jgi:hypothetical protein
MFGNSGKHSWAYFFVVMKGKYKIRESGVGQGLMLTALAFDLPAESQ